MSLSVVQCEISEEEYELVRKLIYERAGINLGDNKHHLVQARLAKRIRLGKFNGFKEYFEYLKSDESGKEIANLIDVISTNTTYFFREPEHFEFLYNSVKQNILERWNKGYVVRIWSAACSSGQEPYSIAMVMRDLLSGFSGVSVKILATDIATSVLDKAKEGRYKTSELSRIAKKYHKYLVKIDEDTFEVGSVVKELITFAKLNLVHSQYPFKYGFDYVFCRNVMIYFDRSTQELVVNKMAGHIKPGGYLIVGHSESLNGIKHPLKYIKPTIYQK